MPWKRFDDIVSVSAGNITPDRAKNSAREMWVERAAFRLHCHFYSLSISEKDIKLEFFFVFRKKVVIRVPLHVKKLHHTHTIYKIIKHGPVEHEGHPYH